MEIIIEWMHRDRDLFSLGTLHLKYLSLLQKELGVLLTPPTGKEKAEDWMGLETKRQLQIKFEDIER